MWEHLDSTHPSPSLAGWYTEQSWYQISCVIMAPQIAQYEINKNNSIKQVQISETWHHLALDLLLLVHIQICELPHFVHSIRLDSSEWKSSPSFKKYERQEYVISFLGRSRRWKTFQLKKNNIEIDCLN